MVGGSAYFSSLTTSGSGVINYTQTNWQIAPNVGYFFVNKFVVGLKPSFSYLSNTMGNTNLKTYTIVPFIRYYFLHTNNRVNIFGEADYQHGISKMTGNPSSSTNGYSIAAGPVVYLNTCVGIEFSVGYSAIYYQPAKSGTVQVGLGLQIHLEKNNN
jgi:hypothetical protein